MRKTLAALFFACILGANAKAGDVVVIANPASGLSKLTREQVINLFLGRYRHLPSGIYAEPIDLPNEDPLKSSFYRGLVQKDVAEINSYWARLVFSGKTEPPRPASGAEHAMRLVATGKGRLAYVHKSMVDHRFVVVYGSDND